jgi:rhomboid protease GluP
MSQPGPSSDNGSISEEPLELTEAMLTTPRRTTRDFEAGMSAAPLVTLGLMALLMAVFIWQFATGSLESTERVIASGALYRAAVLNGEWWRLFSCLFLHGGVEHLLGNLFMLYILGMASEHGLGATRHVLVYFVAGVVGAVLSMSLHPGPSVGASGAIFGLAGAVIAFLYRRQSLFHVRDKRIGWVLLIWAAYTVGLGFLDPQIDNWAHIGGFIGGCVLGALLAPRPALVSTRPG